MPSANYLDKGKKDQTQLTIYFFGKYLILVCK